MAKKRRSSSAKIARKASKSGSGRARSKKVARARRPSRKAVAKARKVPRAKARAKTRVRQPQPIMPKRVVREGRAVSMPKPRMPAVSAIPNLIVTYDPNKRESSRLEVENLLKEVNESPSIQDSGVDGVFKVSVSDAKAAVRRLLDICRKNPQKFEKTYHWVPVEKWCRSDIQVMKDMVREMSAQISQDEKWRMTLDKRHFATHEPDLIIKLTEVVDRPNVDLKNPDKIIKVDIMGDEAGISVLRSDEFLSVPKIKSQQ